MERRISRSGHVNPEESIALGLQMLKTRLDNMPLTRIQRVELDGIISMIARHTGELVKERKLIPMIDPTNSNGKKPKKKESDKK